MKKYVVPIMVVLIGCSSHYDVFSQSMEDLTRLENNLLKEPTNYTYYQELDFSLNTHYQKLTKDQRDRIRTALGTGKFSTITTYSSAERGVRIVIRGTVVDRNQVPITGATVITFQTDASGSYAPTDSITRRMSEPDSRLYGVLHTDREGHFEIHTIRPASYPVRYEGRYVPQHVHVVVSAPNFSSGLLQMVFEDDPAMQDVHWKTWAKEQGFPILKLIPVNGVPTATHIITLQKP